MGKWEIVRLGDVATYVNGYAFKPSDWGDSGLQIIRIQDLTGNSYTTNYYNGQYKEKYRVKDGDVLISWSASLGIYEWNKGDALLNQHIFKVIFDKIKVDKRYFMFAVHFLLAEMGKETHGSTMKHITKPRFDNTQFPLPPLDEQKRIAKNLDLASEIVKGYKEQLAELDKLVQSVFYEMFDSFIGDKSTYKPLPKVANFIDYRGKTPEKSDTGIPLITAKNVKMNSFSLEPQEFIHQNTYEAVMTRGFPRINDVLFTTEAPLGNVCRIPNILNRFVVGQRLITMQPIEGVVNSEYLEFILSSKEFQAEMIKRSSGSTVKGIRSKELVQLSVSVPPFSFQTRFASIVTEIESQKAQVQQALTEAENMFNSLVQEYFE